MKNQDPVLEVLENLASETPEALVPIIDAYRTSGIDGLDEAWKQIIRDSIDANQ